MKSNLLLFLFLSITLSLRSTGSFLKLISLKQPHSKTITAAPPLLYLQERAPKEKENTWQKIYDLLQATKTLKEAQTVKHLIALKKIEKRDKQIIKLLKKKGSQLDFDERDEYQNTLLHIAVDATTPETIKYLLKKISPEAKNLYNSTPFAKLLFKLNSADQYYSSYATIAEEFIQTGIPLTPQNYQGLAFWFNENCITLLATLYHKKEKIKESQKECTVCPTFSNLFNNKYEAPKVCPILIKQLKNSANA